ncbi:hypothetical protein OB955_04920 [Halobacteria archaeon AArc-m2/3/4]|uniref:Uncharacterized protein n=1 Tax=Natronoglomus mannanivorans TaxID=2979990 RepID=A0ABT2QAY0_9EURY|nr:hypothetical protein [Halobacteria archaeon AArc-m2/3/4]
MGTDNEPYATTVDATVSDFEFSTDLPIDSGDFFQLLTNEQTRYVLYLLTERGGTVHLEEITDYFDSSSDEVMLHHTVVPRLVDFHLIDYDQETRAITPTPICDDLTPALETVKILETEPVNEFLEEMN